MSAEELVALVCCDLGAIVRGRSVLAGDLDAGLAQGVGWVPANHALTPLGTLAEPNPFGSTGDLRLLPDAATRTRVEPLPDEARPALDMVLCDIVQGDGAPWECCPRSFLQGRRRATRRRARRKRGEQLRARVPAAARVAARACLLAGGAATAPSRSPHA